MRVIVAVDGSEGSFEAISQVAAVLDDQRDEVALYCHPPVVQVRGGNVTQQILAGAGDSLANAIFAEARSRLPTTMQAKAHTIIGRQDPRQGILLAAEEWAADLIVVGARGLSSVERLVLGSVSRAIVHAARVPVWVARPRPAPASNTPHALLAVDPPESGWLPTGLLTQFHWPPGTVCTALSVIPSIFAGRVPSWLEKQARSPDVEAMVQAWAHDHDDSLANGLARLQKFVASLPPPLQSARSVVVEGEPANMILASAADEHADLIVLGARSKWTLGSAIFGSTVETVLNHAPCSVLIVPHRESP